MAKQPKVRPFNFSHLKKFTAQYLNTVHALLDAYPQFSEDPQFFQEFLNSVCEGLNFKLAGKYVDMEEVTQADFLRGMSSPCLGLVLQAEPQGGRILAEMDYSLGRMLVDKVLGGEGEPPLELLPLSPMEEGIFEFLVAKALKSLKEGSTLMGPSQIRLLKIAHESKIMTEGSGGDERGIVFKFFLGLPSKGGYFKVYFPHPLVEGFLLREDVMAGPGAGEEYSRWERKMSRASHVRASLWSEVGRVSLQNSEKEQLEEGDVILFDETQASLGPHGVAGKTILRIGENPLDGLLAEVVDSEGKLVLKVLDFYGGLE